MRTTKNMKYSADLTSSQTRKVGVKAMAKSGEEQRKKEKRRKKKSSTTISSGGVDDEGALKDNAVITATVDAVVTPSTNSNNDEEEQIVISGTGTNNVVVDDGNDEGIPSPILYDDPNNNAGPSFTDDGLIVATAVETLDNEDEYIYSAIEYDPDSKPPIHRNRRFRVYTCLSLLIVAVVVSITVVYVTRGAKTDVIETVIKLEDIPTDPPTESPTTNREASGIKEQIEAGILLRNVSFSDTENDDPKYRALQWILHDDQLQLESNDPTLYQRYVLALVAYSFDSLAWAVCGNHRSVMEENVEGAVTTTTTTNSNTTNTTAPIMVDYGLEDCEVTSQTTGLVETKKVWLSSTGECDWYGVICSEDGVVRGLELIGNQLIGDIPPEITQLRFLQYLALNGNCIYGTIPPEFGMMSNLLSLELHGNGLSGTIPPELYNADKLQLLNLAMQYGYSMQCTMSNGTLVDTYLERGGTVSFNANIGLQGTVLASDVRNWSSMKGLHLFDNSFGGQINETIGELKYLVFLRAQNNIFSGYIPGALTQLNKLREVMLEKNEMWGDLPPDIGYMEDLEILKVGDGNEMSGTIPDSVYDLTELKQLWLQDTYHCVEDEVGELICENSKEYGFMGSISPSIGNLTKLELLIVNSNPLTGTIPIEIGLCEELAMLRIHKTYIEGSSPRELCMLRDKKLNSEDPNKGVFYADCSLNNRTEEPYFSCDCCSDCCDHTTEVCIADD